MAEINETDVDYDELPKRARSRSRDNDDSSNGGTIYVANLNYKVSVDDIVFLCSKCHISLRQRMKP